MDAFLAEVADTAEDVAAEQRQVARQARSMQRARDNGVSWADVLDGQGTGGDLISRLRQSGRKLVTATTRLSRGLAEGLSSEGHSHRAIGRRLGVTHQRVSAMLNQRADHR